MRVLVIGSGAREHALTLAMSEDVIGVAPGNPGTAAIAPSYEVDVTDPEAIAALSQRLDADLVVIGPEAPLVAGAADAVRRRGIVCFGPSRAAAQIEGSKAFAKDVMAAAGVPTAEPRVCTTPEEIDAALDALGPPYVVKEDGLAAGKGVVVTDDRAEARAHAQSCERVVIEEFLDGPEVSLFCLVDGTTVVPLLPAQDFKRVGDEDAGPNTGGMGAYCPLPWAPADLVDDVVKQVVTPTAEELVRRGAPFAGLLYTGLALTSNGPKVVEFNCRFGDPETQVILPLLASPLAELLFATASGVLADHPPLRWRDEAAVTVMMASAGYPTSSRNGDLIQGSERRGVLHAGTKRRDDGALVTAGGRVLSVTATGADLETARAAAYQLVDEISFDGAHYRSDIAKRSRG